ncbi:hypothetical protein [Amycolatopsis alba]|uniref:Cytochrome C5 n=1 Tax=Amycolatopsis alba DSM 44262 TaxID=1125972 RepID=A0A229RTA6_AMYAL|nr:hypothetical protein [Amycolatopsis alba]OXM49699.1 cytochrome C5 [Amycolatopsis alba DSM 44262]
MTGTEPLVELLRAIQAGGRLASPEVADDTVVDRARLAPAEVDVLVEIDPDLDETPDTDIMALTARATEILDLPAARWRRIVAAVAEEIEAAVGDASHIQEQADLRDDLTIVSLTVWPDTTLISFHAPRQFPDSRIDVQLDENLEVDDLAVGNKDDDG